ncbi:MAG: hypothetical protein AMJ69_08590 [Gammaproteobacteria bacterium SG8_47]|nr:MAG: hypothetical protein AMJ69_08590 [Gammaproteobacteria bacterium SG8_47]
MPGAGSEPGQDTQNWPEMLHRSAVERRPVSRPRPVIGQRRSAPHRRSCWPIRACAGSHLAVAHP